MDKKTLQRHKPNKRELALIDKALERLYDRRLDIPEVSGKVTKSSDDFPYIEGHMTVKMVEPVASAALEKQIREKELRRKVLLKEIEEVEEFIEQLPEGEDKRIFELTYLEGMKQREVAEAVGLDRSVVSRRMSKYFKFAHKTHF